MIRDMKAAIEALFGLVVLTAGIGCGGDEGTRIYCDGNAIRWEAPASDDSIECSDLCRLCDPERSFAASPCQEADGQPFCVCEPDGQAVMCEDGDDVRNVCSTQTCP